MKSAKRQKQGRISEEDMSNLLHRYSAQKVLTLLQEVSQSAESKMNWDALVKKTATGITSAREYQMLWRHIAYCEELLERVDDGAQPLDDESDLEYELEAYPAVSAEASVEAAACVKVLIGDSKVPNSLTVEAPLTINIPNGQSSLENYLPASTQGTIITVPVSVQKQPVPQGSVQKQLVPAGATGEGSDANGSTSANLPPRRKRKPWTEDEDLELMTAVKKCGEGNWANILKGDFKGDRTASQLSQRWAIIRKRQTNLIIGAHSTIPQLSDAQLAARRAIDMALKDNLLTVGNGAATSCNPGTSATSSNPGTLATSSNPGTLSSSNEDNAVVNNTLPQPPQSQSNPAGGNPISSKPGTSSSVPASSSVPTSSSVPNPRAPPKKAPLNPALNSDSSMVTKVAVAAGARLVSPSAAATLFKAAQANNAVHIMPKGGSTLIKPSVTSTSNTTPSTHLGPNRTMPFGSQPVRANLVRPTTSPPTSAVPISHATGSQPVRTTFARAVVLPAPSLKTSASATLINSSSASLSQASQVVNVVGSSSKTSTTPCHPNVVQVKKDEKTSEVMKAPLPPPPHPLAKTVPAQKVEAQQNSSPVSSSAEMVATSQAAPRENSQCLVNTKKEKAVIPNSKDSVFVSVVARNSGDDLKNKNVSSVGGKYGEGSSVKQQEIGSAKAKNLPSSKAGGDGEAEVKSEPTAGVEKSKQKGQ